MFFVTLLLPEMLRPPRGHHPPPPPPVVDELPAEASKRKTELKSEEAPDSAKQPRLENLPHQAWMERFEGPVPNELLCQCKPLSCDLCSVKLNSPLQSK